VGSFYGCQNEFLVILLKKNKRYNTSNNPKYHGRAMVQPWSDHDVLAYQKYHLAKSLYASTTETTLVEISTDCSPTLYFSFACQNIC